MKRAGASALALIAPLPAGRILQCLGERPQRLSELRAESLLAPQTTLRDHLRGLEGVGALTRRGRAGFPGVVEYALTDAGEDLLDVVATVEGWLGERPGTGLAFGSDEGKEAVKALVGGWDSAMLRPLAAGPLSLSEVAGKVSAISYPSVERRLTAMRLAGLVEACPAGGRLNRYDVTEWLRKGTRPLAAAVRWEGSRLPEAVPISGGDAEALFLLALPLLRPSRELSGSCLMGMTMDSDDLAGAIAHVSGGRVSSCTVSRGESADAWATGAVPAWTRAMVGAGTDRIEVGGRRPLASALLEGLGKGLLEAVV